MNRKLGRRMREVMGAGAIALLLAAPPGTASALDFEQRAGFQSPANFVDPGLSLTFQNATPGGYPASTFFDMIWRASGDGPPDSRLNIQTFQSAPGDSPLPTSPSRFSPVQGDANNNGVWDSSEFWTITRLTQTNNVIGIGLTTPIWTVDVPSILGIVGDGSDTHTTAISFFETPNVQNCAQVGPLDNPHGTNCDDVYRVKTSDLTTPVSVSLGGGLFLDLTFQLFAPPGSNVIIGNDATNTWAYTAEASPGTSILDVQMHWAIRRVPLPGSLALLGLGAGVITALRLRRRAA